MKSNKLVMDVLHLLPLVAVYLLHLLTSTDALCSVDGHRTELHDNAHKLKDKAPG